MSTVTPSPSAYKSGSLPTWLTYDSVVMSVMTMTGAIGGISGPLSGAARAAGAATIFYTILDAKKPDTSGRKDVLATEDITLEHVNFSYPTRPEQKVLDDLSLTFPAGKLTAIVGPSGKHVYHST